MNSTRTRGRSSKKEMSGRTDGDGAGLLRGHSGHARNVKQRARGHALGLRQHRSRALCVREARDEILTRQTRGRERDLHCATREEIQRGAGLVVVCGGGLCARGGRGSGGGVDQKHALGSERDSQNTTIDAERKGGESSKYFEEQERTKRKREERQ